ncbi:MAG: SDR family oxidoreductase, partial [Gammaproteobacteria bacterium]|nr:SDR family oxidoreductase [Gammaproteobacteria bacterium]
RTATKAGDALARLAVDGTPIACELSDITSVRAAVAAVKENGIVLDGILANAGIMALQGLKQQHGYELQFFTNHVGHFALVTGLLDQLTERGRVVMLSSGAHRMVGPEGIEFDNLSGERDYHPWRMYAQSKLANILFAKSLASRFEAQGSAHTANAVHPGVIRTNLARHIPDQEGLFSSISKMKTIPQGAATQCYVAVNPESASANGRYFSDCAEQAPIELAEDA